MPGQGRKHLQLAGIGFADAWLGLEASAICWNWICRCLVGVGSICNLLDMNLQIHILGSEASAICWNWICRCLVGVGSICNLLELDLQMPGWSWKHLQFVGIGFADAWPGLEASATCWNWICRCLVGVGSICNLLELDLQMPGQDRKHLQFASIGAADAWSGLEASTTCWI